MDDGQSGVKSKYNIEELRKIHPKIGMKWDKDEDEKLKLLYTQNRAARAGDFDMFVFELTKIFGRAAGGLKARMAMHFTDVPDWDYSREEFRKQELDKLVANKLPEAHDVLLKDEYRKYQESKRETYLSFLKRLSARLGGVEGKLIRYRLEQLVGEVEKFRRDDVNPFSPRGSSSRAPQEDDPLAQFSFADNSQAQEALRIMDTTSENLFLTGEAGTGKSTLLQYFRHSTQKNIAVLAPTGVAAINVGGQTIHSFCAFGPDITLHKVKKLGPSSGKFQLLQKLNTLVIDEISMVRADLLDCVDKFLRLNGPAPTEPFGGLQMIFIGDLYQLPPVDRDFVTGDGLFDAYKSPYFFDSKCFRTAKFNHIQLKQMYRQKDGVFIDVLNAVRNNAATQEHLSVINQRAEVAGAKFTFEKFAIYLTPHNHQARKVNNYFLERITSPLKTYKGEVRGSFEDREPPTDLDLQVKIGAQIMMLTNDQRKRWVNGTMGKVVGIQELKEEDEAPMSPSPQAWGDAPSSTHEGQRGRYGFDESDHETSSVDSIIIALETGETVYVEPHTWEMFQFTLDKHTQKVDSKTTGTFTQYPFKLAWAVTIHKAQGKTFDKVYIDLSTGTFAHGQLYVALSRCRTLEGIYLKRPITSSDIILDNRIVEFLHSLNPTEEYYSTAEE